MFLFNRFTAVSTKSSGILKCFLALFLQTSSKLLKGESRICKAMFELAREVVKARLAKAPMDLPHNMNFL
jgi:hypothetical protein